MSADNLYVVGNRITFRNADNVQLNGKIIRLTSNGTDTPEYVEIHIDNKGIFNFPTRRMYHVTRRYFEDEEFDIEPSSTITVGELKARLNRLPDDVTLATHQYTYYCDLLYVESTGEILWKP